MSRQAIPATAKRQTSVDEGGAGEARNETERSIIAATERLLGEVPLHELSVAQIIKEAGVSRATFYFYFGSKFAVIGGLLAEVMGEIYGAVRPFLDRPPEIAREDALRQSLEASTALWADHRPALRAVVESWSSFDELRSAWLGAVRRFTGTVAAEIDRERAEGRAPPGPDSRHLAASLVWATERCLYVAGLGIDEDVPDEQSLLEPLMALWMAGLYRGVSAPIQSS